MKKILPLLLVTTLLTQAGAMDEKEAIITEGKTPVSNDNNNIEIQQQKIHINMLTLAKEWRTNPAYGVVNSAVETLKNLDLFKNVDPASFAQFNVDTFCKTQEGEINGTAENFGKDTAVLVIMTLKGLTQHHTMNCKDLYDKMQGVLSIDKVRELGYSREMVHPTPVQKTEKGIKKIFKKMW